MNRIRIGSAVTAHAMPTPAMNCHDVADAPIQLRSWASIRPAASAPNSSGTPIARLAVVALSRRLAQASCRSSSIPAIHTNTITAHAAMPLSARLTSGLNTRW